MENSSDFLSQLEKDRSEGNGYHDLNNVIALIKSFNKDFKLSDEEIKVICKNNFVIENFVDKEDEDETYQMVEIESLFKFFERKLSAKINVNDYIESSLNFMIKVYSDLEINLNSLFERLCSQNIMFFTEFDSALKKIFANSENKWKGVEYFR